ncbi:MAG: hypothetical protein QOG75_2889 [Mycobacterium sp.]|nr:hypothetical protein [Mycobacterium sp.]
MVGSCQSPINFCQRNYPSDLGVKPLRSVNEVRKGPNAEEGIEMRKFGFGTLISSGLTAAVLGFAGPAQADIVTTPTLPHYSVDNHDEVNTTNGFVDRPF